MKNKIVLLLILNSVVSAYGIDLFYNSTDSEVQQLIVRSFSSLSGIDSNDFSKIQNITQQIQKELDSIKPMLPDKDSIQVDIIAASDGSLMRQLRLLDRIHLAERYLSKMVESYLLCAIDKNTFVESKLITLKQQISNLESLNSDYSKSLAFASDKVDSINFAFEGLIGVMDNYKKIIAEQQSIIKNGLPSKKISLALFSGPDFFFQNNSVETQLSLGGGFSYRIWGNTSLGIEVITSIPKEIRTQVIFSCRFHL